MGGQMDGWIDQCYRWIDVWMYERTNIGIDGCMNKLNGKVDERIGGATHDGRTDGEITHPSYVYTIYAALKEK